jgi:pimeloyl-ACP methyl ester carboxylesterase
VALRALSDGALFAEAFGNGPPRVLALHGWGRRGSDFAPSLANFDALAVDLPGFGATPAPEEVLGANGYARLVAPVLDAFETPPVVVGHSFGGRIAVCLAAAHPDRVASLIISGAPLVRLAPGRKPSVTYRLLRFLHQVGLIGDVRMEEIRRSRGSADYRAATGVMREILVKVVNESYEDELTRLKSRVILLWGEDDGEVPVAVAERSLRIIRQAGGSAELEVLPGIGHLLPTQAPETISRALAEELRT